MKSCVATCAKLPDEIDSPAPASSIASRSRPQRGGPRGYDAGKKICGRKRHLLVDTLGLLLRIVVHPADVQDRDGARQLLGPLASTFLSLRHLWADGAYAGDLVQWVGNLRGRLQPLRMEIVRRSDDVRGFKVLPRRWVVERTFGWWGRFRRLSKDYEFHTATSEAMIHLVMIAIMLRRLV